MARMANLIIHANQTSSPAELKKELLRLARQQGKPYGILIKGMHGGDTQTRRSGWSSYQAFRGIPRLAYRVDAETGQEEMVRGVEVVGTPLISVNKIVAAGDQADVFNGFCGAESGYVPLGQVSPSILLSELELQRSGVRKQKPPILDAP